MAHPIYLEPKYHRLPPVIYAQERDAQLASELVGIAGQKKIIYSGNTHIIGDPDEWTTAYKKKLQAWIQKNSPDLWFSQIEAQFDIATITNENTRFSYVIANLEEKQAREVEDVIKQPPTENPYSYLKKVLISRLCASEETRIKQILFEEELGDRRPSQFLRHLRSLAGHTTIGESMFRSLWMQRLPAYIRAILQTQCDLPLDKLAATADKILEVQPLIHHVDSTKQVHYNKPSEQRQSDQLEELTKQVRDLQKQIRYLNQKGRSRSKSRERVEYTKCWYHNQFGRKARKCQAPCSWNMYRKTSNTKNEEKDQ
ncbi:uncharacterized protein LOC113381732 [Ctenocephalides felis]|uniref:uncharacterized protein LOC113381732 n=1 Tax=Ctenocephalides felis TaxID=7515 RepID=UPI000E6E5918|nr:uncharacterized protein LOC113381732 [Ctenocephalides felis]